jgi:uncharacterized protein (UPF0548 family)
VPSGRRSGSERAWQALDQLHEKGLNFDAEGREEHVPENGWHVDDYRQALPSEEAGEPAADGSWEAARRLMRDYEFADPSLIRAVFHPEQPLEQRDMLLEARFLGLRFHLGVRVGGVNDQRVEVDGEPVRVWGWNYRTLQGHLEMGQMDFEVWKWLRSGRVDFRIHAVSKPAHIRNPLVRAGFHLVGRRLQRRFAERACERMAALVDAEQRGGRAAEERTLERLDVQPAAADPGADRRLRRAQDD